MTAETPEERKIDILVGFSKPKNVIFPIFSWAIRLIERTEYSHCYVRWYSVGAKVWVTYHASGTQVNFFGPAVFDKKVAPLEEYKFQVTRGEYKELLNFCMTNAGVDYGQLGVLGIGFSKLAKWVSKTTGIGIDSKNPFQSGKITQWCSKLVFALLSSLGKLSPEDSAMLEVAGPRQINEIVRNMPGVERIL